MLYRILADSVAVVHFLFVVFVIAGGFLALRWTAVAWAHLPAAVWGAAIELAGWHCPLTPLENRLRLRGGEAGYEGGFVETYILSLIYPETLPRHVQLFLGMGVIVVNAIAYTLVIRRRK
ncbi:MAG TPA: DUF2784 domain-containing protein [Thermoanaerobaculia bacterium]|nr:DUF2784 domain-containing protein [Thermoanaerobaculia bacterium]